MSISTRWYNSQKTIIVHEFGIPWEWSQFAAELKTAFTLLDEVQHPVCIILDFTLNSTVPNNALAHIRRAANRKHHNLQSVIIVGSNSLLTALAQVVARISPKLFENRHLVRTMDDAMSIIDAASPKYSTTPAERV